MASTEVGESSVSSYEFRCTPCSKEEQNVEAVRFCLECQVYMCEPCLKQHNRFPPMESHPMLDQSEMGAKAHGGHSPSSLPKEKCAQHQGKVQDMYCMEHEVVCCTACVAKYHRSCTGIDYLPDLAKGVKDSELLKDVKDSMEAVKANLVNILKARDDDRLRIEEQRDAALTKVGEFRQRMNKLLDDMEKQTKEQIKQKYKKFETNINADLEFLDELIQSFERHIKLLDKDCEDVEYQVFLHVKQGQKVQESGIHLSQVTEKSIGKEKIKYIMNKDIEEHLTNAEGFGYFMNECQHYNDINVKMNDDSQTCNVFGSCQLENGQILITDSANDKVKRLDAATYAVLDSCEVQFIPWGICSTGPSEVAVTLMGSMKVQFISVDKRLSRKRSFSVGVMCRGITYNDDGLYVACCGFSDESDSPGHIRVYSVTGQKLQIFENYQSGQQLFSFPKHVATSFNAEQIHVMDSNKGVMTLNKKGQVSTATVPMLPMPAGVCIDSRGQLIICGINSNNIVQLGIDGSTCCLLLTEVDGVSVPLSVCYDRKHSRLIVTMGENDLIKIFDLK